MSHASVLPLANAASVYAVAREYVDVVLTDIRMPRLDGIEFIAGRRLMKWLHRVDGRPVSGDAAKDVLERVVKYRLKASSTQNASR